MKTKTTFAVIFLVIFSLSTCYASDYDIVGIRFGMNENEVLDILKNDFGELNLEICHENADHIPITHSVSCTKVSTVTKNTKDTFTLIINKNNKDGLISFTKETQYLNEQPKAEMLKNMLIEKYGKPIEEAGLEYMFWLNNSKREEHYLLCEAIVSEGLVQKFRCEMRDTGKIAAIEKQQENTTDETRPKI